MKFLADRTDRLAFALTGIFLGALLFAGPVLHPVETNGEADIYAEKAQNIAEGRSPQDPYHTLLYHLLTAACGKAFGGDYFAGGRFVSACFAAIFIWYAYKTARRVFGPRIGLFTLAATAANPIALLYAFCVTTDMAFSALSMYFLYRLVLFSEKPSPRRAFVAGLGFALAYFARQAAVLYFPAVIAVFITTPAVSRARLAAVFAASFFLFSIPSMAVTLYYYNVPFLNVHWKNLALRMYGTHGESVDWEYVYRSDLPFDGWFSVIARSPGRLLEVLREESGLFFRKDLPCLFGGGAVGVTAALAVGSGMARAIMRRGRTKMVLLAFVWSNVLGLCAFFTWPRYLLPGLPVGYAFIGYALCAKRGRMRTAGMVAAVLALAAVVWSGAETMRWFYGQHPLTEIAATKRVEKESGNLVRIMGTSRPMKRLLACNYLTLPIPLFDEEGDPGRYLARLKEALRQERTDYVIVGTLSASPALQKWALLEEYPPFLEPYFSDKGVAVYRVKKDAL